MNNILRDLRLEIGLTQKELAKKLGSTDKNIWAYEKGIASPPYDVLTAYADFFSVSTDYLLGRTDDFKARIPASSSPTAALMGERLTKDERELLDDFRKLSPYLQGIARNTVRGLTGAGAQGSDLPKKA